MKKFLTIFILISIAIGSSYVVAQLNTTSAPANNTTTPLNVGLGDQVKTGDISVNAFSVSKSALFEKSVILQGILTGSPVTTTKSTLSIGGTDPSGVRRTVDLLTTNGKVTVSNTVKLSSLVTPQPTNKELCATSSGTLVFCGDNTTTTSGSCGNNIIESGEMCDTGNLNGTSASNCSLLCQYQVTNTPPRTAVNVQVLIAPAIVLPLTSPITSTTYPCGNPGGPGFTTKTAYINTSIAQTGIYDNAYLYNDTTTNGPALLATTQTGNNNSFLIRIINTAFPNTTGRDPIFGYNAYYAQQHSTSTLSGNGYAQAGQLSGDLGSCTD